MVAGWIECRHDGLDDAAAFARAAASARGLDAAQEEALRSLCRAWLSLERQSLALLWTVAAPAMAGDRRSAMVGAWFRGLLRRDARQARPEWFAVLVRTLTGGVADLDPRRFARARGASERLTSWDDLVTRMWQREPVGGEPGEAVVVQGTPTVRFVAEWAARQPEPRARRTLPDWIDRLIDELKDAIALASQGRLTPGHNVISLALNATLGEVKHGYADFTMPTLRLWTGRKGTPGMGAALKAYHRERRAPLDLAAGPGEARWHLQPWRLLDRTGQPWTPIALFIDFARGLVEGPPLVEDGRFAPTSDAVAEAAAVPLDLEGAWVGALRSLLARARARCEEPGTWEAGRARAAREREAGLRPR